MGAMYPHTMTAWRPTEEGRSISWERLGTIPCRFDAERDINSSASGDDASWTASILVPSQNTEPPLKRGDRVCLGARDDANPVPGSMKVTRCDPVSLDRPEPDHWEAVAR